MEGWITEVSWRDHLRLQEEDDHNAEDDLPVREVAADLMPPAVGRRADAVGAVDVPREAHVVQPVAGVVEGALDVVRGVR